MWERVSYSPYGAPSFTDTVGNATPASSVGNSILFTGREYDAITGTYYFRARTQHPALGRFMQKDPLMYVDGMNDYSYVGNSAINYVDSSGFAKIKAVVSVTKAGWKLMEPFAKPYYDMVGRLLNSVWNIGNKTVKQAVEKGGWIASFALVPQQGAKAAENCEDGMDNTNDFIDNLKKSVVDDDLLFWRNDWWGNILSGNGDINDWQRLGWYILL